MSPDFGRDLHPRSVFRAELQRSGDYRVAAQRAGVSERTGRRWRAELSSEEEDPPASTPPLPSTLTEFVGRDAELEQLTRRLNGARLVTLLGPGGVGKTRLALRSAEQRGGAWFCDLTEARTATDVAGIVGRVLGVPIDAADPAAQVGRALAGRGSALVVLDNAEQVVAAAGELARRWLEAAPRARLLVTSRIALEVPGEVVFHLEPLELPGDDEQDHDVILRSEAVRLFLARAELVRGSSPPPPDEAPLLSRIVRALDGLPLAIELAAARAALLSPRELLAALAARFELLVTSSRALPERQRSMRATIAWSYELLTADEREALETASVFCGGFALEAAARVLADGGAPVLDRLQALRAHSLLHVERRGSTGAARFRLLESIREHASFRLRESGRHERAFERHATHYLDLAEALSSKLDRHGGQEAVLDLALEIENLIAVHRRALTEPRGEDAAAHALRAALALHPLLSVRGPIEIHQALLDEALAAVVDESAVRPLVARALVARAIGHRVIGRVGEGRADLDRALALARSIGDRETEIRALASLAMMHHVEGRFDDAEALYREGLAIACASSNRALEGTLLGNLALLLRVRARGDEAVELAERALAIHREVGNGRLEGYVLGTLAALLAEQRRFEEAKSHALRAIELVHAASAPLLEAHLHAQLGLLHHTRGELAEARERHERALEQFRHVGNPRSEGMQLGVLASVLAEQGEVDEARRHYERELALLRPLGERRHLVSALGALGGLEADLGRLEIAEGLLREAGEHLGDRVDPTLVTALALHRGRLDVARARTASLAGDAEAAAAHRERARAALKGVAHDAFELGPTVRLLARALELEGAESAPAARAKLTLGDDDRAFRVGDGPKVSLARHGPARLLLVELVQRRLAAPGRAFSTDELRAAGWPGESIRADAATSRVYMAIATLRKLGLGSLLLRRNEGYLIDPDVEVTRVARL